MAWNFILKDFPKYRLDFIKRLSGSGSYQLILLSNTNELHIQFIKEHFSFYEEFKSCFHQFYLSHEIHMRKPDRSIFDFVLRENSLNAEECLFIDDTKENTDVAAAMGIKTWTIDENSEDVVDLFKIKKHLF
jgi:putative hydrolase of the HAD superfamily